MDVLVLVRSFALYMAFLYLFVSVSEWVNNTRKVEA